MDYIYVKIKFKVSITHAHVVDAKVGLFHIFQSKTTLIYFIGTVRGPNKRPQIHIENCSSSVYIDLKLIFSTRAHHLCYLLMFWLKINISGSYHEIAIFYFEKKITIYIYNCQSVLNLLIFNAAILFKWWQDNKFKFILYLW